MNWIKAGRKVTSDETVNYYQAAGARYTIESRKRAIPHANREGSWMYTSFYVLLGGEVLAEKQSLGSAKDFAEKHAEGTA